MGNAVAVQFRQECQSKIQKYRLERQRQERIPKPPSFLLLKFLSSISIGTYYDVRFQNVTTLLITKRPYGPKDSGPDTMIKFNQHQINKTVKVTEPALLQQLVQYQWLAWQPDISWRMKVNQVYDIEFVGKVNGDISTSSSGHPISIKCRVGPSWIGPTLDSTLSDRAWFHQFDGHGSPTESRFYQCIHACWLELEPELPVEDHDVEDAVFRAWTQEDALSSSAFRQRFQIEKEIFQDLMENLVQTVEMNEHDRVDYQLRELHRVHVEVSQVLFELKECVEMSQHDHRSLIDEDDS